MKPTFDILVAGEINPDLILSGDVVPSFGQEEKLVDSANLTVGSSSVIFACGAAKLGLKVIFAGVCGEDVFGHFMLDEMSKRGIEISNVSLRPDRQTGLSVILSKGNDRAILTHPGSIPDLQGEDLPDRILVQARHLHVASYFLQVGLQSGLPQLFERARSHGLTTSLDTNWDPLNLWKGIVQLLPLVDVFLPNEKEAMAISSKASVEEAIEFLAKSSHTVAIKLGSEGAIAWNASERVTTPSLKVKMVDSVGAGDSFDAGFLFGFLQNWDLKKSLHFACVCGALSTRATGGTASQPTLQEAMQYA